MEKNTQCKRRDCHRCALQHRKSVLASPISVALDAAAVPNFPRWREDAPRWAAGLAHLSLLPSFPAYTRARIMRTPARAFCLSQAPITAAASRPRRRPPQPSTVHSRHQHFVLNRFEFKFLPGPSNSGGETMFWPLEISEGQFQWNYATTR
jgi:hypothetical protein